LPAVNIFISWSGDHSGHVSQTLREYVPLVIQSATCFLSKNDIEAGTQWMTEVFDKLDARSIGLICITKDNQDRPWINFEAGALAFRLGKPRVVPILIDLEAAELKAPLGSFEYVRCDREGLFAMFETIKVKFPQRYQNSHRNFHNLLFLKAFGNPAAPGPGAGLVGQFWGGNTGCILQLSSEKAYSPKGPPPPREVHRMHKSH
jgi:hypothetical protein